MVKNDRPHPAGERVVVSAADAAAAAALRHVLQSQGPAKRTVRQQTEVALRFVAIVFI